MLILRSFTPLALSVAVLCSMAMDALAAEPKLLGRFNDWSAYVFEDGGSKVCYMASTPTQAEGNYTNRGNIFTMITHWQEDSLWDQFSVLAGYTYREDSSVDVSVGGLGQYELFTEGDSAWAEDSDDGKLALAIRRGSRMVIKGTSSRGTLTTDTYSLSGSNAAYRAISQECGRPL